jgi:hypothetical protein
LTILPATEIVARHAPGPPRALPRSFGQKDRCLSRRQLRSRGRLSESQPRTSGGERPADPRDNAGRRADVLVRAEKDLLEVKRFEGGWYSGATSHRHTHVTFGLRLSPRQFP